MTHIKGEMSSTSSKGAKTKAPKITAQSIKPAQPDFVDTTKMHKSHGGRVLRKGW